jgi:hypothetical protein
VRDVVAVDLDHSRGDQLGDAQAEAEGKKDHSGTAPSAATSTSGAGRGDQAVGHTRCSHGQSSLLGLRRGGEAALTLPAGEKAKYLDSHLLCLQHGFGQGAVLRLSRAVPRIM